MGAHRGIASRLVGPSCASRRAIVLTLTSACPGASLKARESQTEVSEPQSWAQGSTAELATARPYELQQQPCKLAGRPAVPAGCSDASWHLPLR